MEKAKFIKKIWKEMGEPTQECLALKLSMNESVIKEHLSLIDEKTRPNSNHPYSFTPSTLICNHKITLGAIVGTIDKVIHY